MTCSAPAGRQGLLTVPMMELEYITVITMKMLVSDVYVSFNLFLHITTVTKVVTILLLFLLAQWR